ncbi:MAG: F0F1 ATP synthase subunit gamma [Alphaproteobacteria bacterium]|nr:F0F1 ATP synthase subunit gamma [Alphaproteobacteria bacterium]NDC55944.1 F0F1 ATP synthase subunit gamma [Alphaproteobacteria bacterium]
MPSLKELKNRIGSVKNTRKITSAMKMVAASKLRRMQEMAIASRPYTTALARMLDTLTANLVPDSDTPKLLTGTGKADVHLLVVMTADRGLCGAYNANVVKETRRRIRALQGEGKQVKLLCVGRKGRDLLRRDFGSLIVHTFDDVGRKRLSYAEAEAIGTNLLTRFEAGEFDVCSLVFNQFKSVLSQVVTVKQLVPWQVAANQNAVAAPIEFEPDAAAILGQLLPKNVTVQMYSALLESAASEQGARMTAMDNATRNAGDMITRLTLNYNRSRQAFITKELIEIISGAEAV